MVLAKTVAVMRWPWVTFVLALFVASTAVQGPRLVTHSHAGGDHGHDHRGHWDVGDHHDHHHDDYHDETTDGHASLEHADTDPLHLHGTTLGTIGDTPVSTALAVRRLTRPFVLRTRSPVVVHAVWTRVPRGPPASSLG